MILARALLSYRARDWATAVMVSRLEQGISPRGAGGFETAVSR